MISRREFLSGTAACAVATALPAIPVAAEPPPFFGYMVQGEADVVAPAARADYARLLRAFFFDGESYWPLDDDAPAPWEIAE